tara:strand:+ start:391 stop:900 length:510 start_codon:yes stop_codon:yes gene_type:complete
MNLKTFYETAITEHQKAVKEMKDKRNLPYPENYKTIKTVSSDGYTVTLISTLGNAKIKTRYMHKSDNYCITEFFLFDNLILSNKSDKDSSHCVTLHIGSSDLWFSVTTFKHINNLINQLNISLGLDPIFNIYERVAKHKKVPYLHKGTIKAKSDKRQLQLNTNYILTSY